MTEEIKEAARIVRLGMDKKLYRNTGIVIAVITSKDTVLEKPFVLLKGRSCNQDMINTPMSEESFNTWFDQYIAYFPESGIISGTIPLGGDTLDIKFNKGSSLPSSVREFLR